MAKVTIHPWISMWGVKRDTSPEIAQAIHELRKGDAERLWEAPSEVEETDVVRRAWELADDTVEFLHWGEKSYTRFSVGGCF